MSGITDQSAATHGTDEPLDKGKGKAAAPVPEDTEGETSDEETVDPDAMEVEEEDDDDLAEIDSKNIITTGRRTRGKQIDFAKAAAEQPAADEDSEDDEDFVAAEDGDKTDHEMH